MVQQKVPCYLLVSVLLPSPFFPANVFRTHSHTETDRHTTRTHKYMHNPPSPKETHEEDLGSNADLNANNMARRRISMQSLDS